MENEVVRRRGWLSPEAFLDLLGAAEAHVELLGGADVEGAGALIVEGAVAEVAVHARSAQLGARGDERHHVDGVEHPVA